MNHIFCEWFYPQERTKTPDCMKTMSPSSPHYFSRHLIEVKTSKFSQNMFWPRPHTPMLFSYYVDAPFTTFSILNVVKHLIGSWTHTWGADAWIQQLLFWSLGLISTCKFPLHFCIFGGSVDDSSSLKLLILCLEPTQRVLTRTIFMLQGSHGELNRGVPHGNILYFKGVT